MDFVPGATTVPVVRARAESAWNFWADQDGPSSSSQAVAGTDTLVPVSRVSCWRVASMAVAVAAMAIVVDMGLFGWVVSGFVAMEVGRWAIRSSTVRADRVGLSERVERVEGVERGGGWLWVVAIRRLGGCLVVSTRWRTSRGSANSCRSLLVGRGVG